MSDATSLQGNIYHLNGADPEKVLAALVEHGITGTDYDKHTADNYTDISASGTYFHEYDIRCGSADMVATDLIELGVTFMLWEDPAYEWLGQLEMHHPKIGTFTAQCDANGNALMTDHQAKNLMVDGRWYQDAIHKIDELLGVTYQIKFADLLAAAVVAP